MYKFIKETKENRIEYIVNSNDISWPNLLEEFFWFLLSCSFVFCNSSEELVAAAVEANDVAREEKNGKKK